MIVALLTSILLHANTTYKSFAIESIDMLCQKHATEEGYEDCILQYVNCMDSKEPKECVDRYNKEY